MSLQKSYQKYYIKQYSVVDYQHGGIGYVDAEKVFEQEGFEPIFFPAHHDFSLRGKLKRVSFLIKLLFKIRRPAVVIFIVPAYSSIVKLLIQLLIRKKGIQLVCFIADIDGIKGNDKIILEREMRLFRSLKFFIVMNDKAGEWLRNVNPLASIASLNFFSFLTVPIIKIRTKSNTIVFAGNLEKSPFLEQLNSLWEQSPQLQFNLYGPGANDRMINQPNVSYKGIIDPYNLTSEVEGAFGLIWEGESIDETAGAIGLYTRYISNHKLSLYIMSGLPVILWQDAGAAYLVRKYNIGFTINNLHEVAEKITGLSKNDYLQMQQNMKPLAEKISQGLFQKEAMNDLLKKL